MHGKEQTRLKYYAHGDFKCAQQLIPDGKVVPRWGPQDLMSKTKTKTLRFCSSMTMTKTSVHVLEEPQDQDHGLEGYNTDTKTYENQTELHVAESANYII